MRMQKNSIWDHYRVCKSTRHSPVVVSPGHLPPLIKKKIPQQKQYYKIWRAEHEKLLEKYCFWITTHAGAGFETC